MGAANLGAPCPPWPRMGLGCSLPQHLCLPTQALEMQLKAQLGLPVPGTKVPVPGTKGLPVPGTSARFQTCLTMQEVFSQQRATCPGLTYHRVPLPDFCAPQEEVRRKGPEPHSQRMGMGLLGDGCVCLW